MRYLDIRSTYKYVTSFSDCETCYVQVVREWDKRIRPLIISLNNDETLVRDRTLLHLESCIHKRYNL